MHQTTHLLNHPPTPQTPDGPTIRKDSNNKDRRTTSPMEGEERQQAK
jgi:hypothetical protein